jgi:Zn-dependent metalloprotease
MNMTLSLIIAGVGAAATLASSSCSSCREPDAPRFSSFDEIAQPIESPGWITFKASAQVNPKSLFKDHAGLFQLPSGNEMKVTSENVDDLGITHLRFQQLYRGVEVEDAEFRVRAKANVAISANGKLEYQFAPTTTQPAVTEERALEVLLQRIPGVRFYDEDDLVEDLRREPGATPHRPKGKLVFVELPDSSERVLAWMFRAYTSPIGASRRSYVDATSAALVKEVPLAPSCFAGGGNTTFRGFQPFNTSRAQIPGVGDNFVLDDDCHGNSLIMLRAKQVAGTRHVFDADNNWNDSDIAAVMSFYGLGVAYDYFALQHGRRSWTGTNRDMGIINDPKEPNASGGGGVIFCGTGPTNSPNDDYNTVDIIGHEFTHSVIENTARLSTEAAKESAALNESFSDIFGSLIERWDEQNATPEWIIGDDKGCGGTTCRDLLNPKSFNHPDTYKGTFFQSSGIDPHVNGGVQNRWFALLTDGGKGTNTELRAPYDIQGLGVNRTARIVYRSLTLYLTADSTFVDARNGSIQATRDLFGVNSVSENQVIKAWCAVGLCPFTMPTQADIFDRPGGNPNPASPNNNNTSTGATPLPTGEVALRVDGPKQFNWSRGAHPQLKVSGLSIFPTNDIDYFRISFPKLDTLDTDCFVPGFAFSFGREVNARILIDGAVRRTFKQVANFTTTLSEANAESFVLEVAAPFPGQLVEYNLSVRFYLRVDPSCIPQEPLDKWKQIHDCIACDRDVLSGIDRVILDPDYRQLGGVAAKDHFIFWRGEGELDVPITVLQGNSLTVDLVDGSGRMIATVARDQATSAVSLRGGRVAPGVYSLRFRDFGNGTQIDIKAPVAP